MFCSSTQNYPSLVKGMPLQEWAIHLTGSGQLLESAQLTRPLLIALPPLHPTIFTSGLLVAMLDSVSLTTVELTSGEHSDRTKEWNEEDLVPHPPIFTQLATVMPSL